MVNVEITSADLIHLIIGEVDPSEDIGYENTIQDLITYLNSGKGKDNKSYCWLKESK